MAFVVFGAFGLERPAVKKKSRKILWPGFVGDGKHSIFNVVITAEAVVYNSGDLY